MYTDACNEGLVAILQQIQPIKIKDLKGTKAYDKLSVTFQQGNSVPRLVILTCKDETLPVDVWGENFEDTEVHIERVIIYWS